MKEFIDKLIEKIVNTPTKCLDTYSISCPNVIIAIKNGIEYGCASRQNEIIDIINEFVEEYKEECNLQSDKILFAYSDLLRRFRQAEESCIWEFSGSIENDIKELEEECEQLLDGFNALLYSSYEYDNGWIACSERLPEVEADVLLSLRSLDVYTGFMANTEGCFYVEGEGYVEFENVLAWQPLPAPYRPDEHKCGTSEAWKQQTMSRFERVE